MMKNMLVRLPLVMMCASVPVTTHCLAAEPTVSLEKARMKARQLGTMGDKDMWPTLMQAIDRFDVQLRSIDREKRNIAAYAGSDFADANFMLWSVESTNALSVQFEATLLSANLALQELPVAGEGIHTHLWVDAINRYVRLTNANTVQLQACIEAIRTRHALLSPENEIRQLQNRAEEILNIDSDIALSERERLRAIVFTYLEQYRNIVQDWRSERPYSEPTLIATRREIRTELQSIRARVVAGDDHHATENRVVVRIVDRLFFELLGDGKEEAIKLQQSTLHRKSRVFGQQSRDLDDAWRAAGPPIMDLIKYFPM